MQSAVLLQHVCFCVSLGTASPRALLRTSHAWLYVAAAVVMCMCTCRAVGSAQRSRRAAAAAGTRQRQARQSATAGAATACPPRPPTTAAAGAAAARLPAAAAAAWLRARRRRRLAAGVVRRIGLAALAGAAAAVLVPAGAAWMLTVRCRGGRRLAWAMMRSGHVGAGAKEGMSGSGKVGLQDGAGVKAALLVAAAMEVVVGLTGSVILRGCMTGSRRLRRGRAEARCRRLLRAGGPA